VNVLQELWLLEPKDVKVLRKHNFLPNNKDFAEEVRQIQSSSRQLPTMLITTLETEYATPVFFTSELENFFTLPKLFKKSRSYSEDDIYENKSEINFSEWLNDM
jgi:hypothetical protein